MKDDFESLAIKVRADIFLALTKLNQKNINLRNLVKKQARFSFFGGAFNAMVLLLAVTLLITGCRSTYRADPVANYQSKKSNIFRYANGDDSDGNFSIAVKNLKQWTRDGLLDNVPFHINPMIYKDGTFGTNSLYSVASSEGIPLQIPTIITNTYPTYRTNGASITTNFFTCITNTSWQVVSAEKSRIARNRLQNTMIAIAYENGAQHSAGVKSIENLVNLLMGGATIGLSAGSSVATATTARALAAAATGTAGARSLFNEETFRNNLSESMFQAMDSARALYRATNILELQKLPVSDYDVAAAIHDAEVYNEMASFYYQLALVLKDVGAATKARNDSVQNALNEQKGPKASEVAKRVGSPRFKEQTGRYEAILKDKKLKDSVKSENPGVETVEKYAEKMAEQKGHTLNQVMSYPNLESQFLDIIEELEKVTEPK